MGRTGMKLGEGYGILVLERQADAKQPRVSTHWLTSLGFGESSDAHHLTQPHPAGAGAAAAIHAALERSSQSITDIGLICAHATGTPDNDASEHTAYAAVFGEQLRATPVAGLKSHFGHTLGGRRRGRIDHGDVCIAIAADSTNGQHCPRSSRLCRSPDHASKAEPSIINATLNTSLGFGGANTCMVLGRNAHVAVAAETVARGSHHWSGAWCCRALLAMTSF